MDLLSMFEGSDTREKVGAGTTIFHEGDAGDRMYVILEGEVGVERRGERLRTTGPGEVLGEMALVDDSPRSADAVAVTDCVLVPVDERRFLFLVNQTPTFALHVMGVIADRLRSRDEEG